MKLWDIYDENRKKKGRVVLKGDNLRQGDYRLAVHICIFNSRNELLIQKRKEDKELMPGLWDISAGGSASTGEDSRQAASRVVLEELGLKLDFKNERPYFTMNFEEGFDDYYLIRRELDLDSLKIDKKSLDQVRWASKEEVETLVETGEFIDYYMVPGIFFMIDDRGSFREKGTFYG